MELGIKLNIRLGNLSSKYGYWLKRFVGLQYSVVVDGSIARCSTCVLIPSRMVQSTFVGSLPGSPVSVAMVLNRR